MDSYLMPLVDFESFSGCCLDDPRYSSPSSMDHDCSSPDSVTPADSLFPSPSTPSGMDSDDGAFSSSPNPQKRKRGSANGAKRKQVKRACSNCRKAHAGCDENRPCRRCVGGGKEGSCKDVPRKKRSRTRIGEAVIGSQDDIIEKPVSSPKRKRSKLVDSGNHCSAPGDNKTEESSAELMSTGSTHKTGIVKKNSTGKTARKSLMPSLVEKTNQSDERMGKPLSKKIKLERSGESEENSEADHQSTEDDEEAGQEKKKLKPVTKMEPLVSIDLNDSIPQTQNGEVSWSNLSSLTMLSSSSSSSTLGGWTSLPWNSGFGGESGLGGGHMMTTMEGKLQDLLGEVKYSLNYQQHSLSMQSAALSGYEDVAPAVVMPIQLLTSEEGLGCVDAEIGSESAMMYGWDDLLQFGLPSCLES